MPETKKEKITPKKAYARDTRRLHMGRYYTKGGNVYKNTTIEDDYSDIGNDTEKYDKFLKAEEKLKNLTYSPTLELKNQSFKSQELNKQELHRQEVIASIKQKITSIKQKITSIDKKIVNYISKIVELIRKNEIKKKRKRYYARSSH